MPSGAKTFNVLAIDGGGMKGLFAGTLLERLHARAPALLDNVDLVAGASTGAIIALGLAAGLSPTAITTFYRESGAVIFDDSLLDDVLDLGRARGAEYSHRGLKKVLRKAFGKDTTLGDLNHRVLIPAFDLDAEADGRRPRMWKAKFFHNFPGRGTDRNELVVDVALRTASAPSFFPTYQGHIDGGVVANNPAMAALAQALDKRAGKAPLESVRLLSLGTGAEPKRITGNKDWGWGQWARPLVSIMVGGGMGVVDFQCRQILGDHYHRLDAYLDRAVELDDHRPRTLRYLERKAHEVRLAKTFRWIDDVGW